MTPLLRRAQLLWFAVHPVMFFSSELERFLGKLWHYLRKEKRFLCKWLLRERLENGS